MRPIERPLLGASGQARAAGPLLLATLGDYCSICERPLPNEAWVLNRVTGEVSSWSVGTEGWRGLLLVCHNCRDAHLAAGAAGMGQLLFPDDEELSFRVRGESPLTYALEAVRVVTVAEDGSEQVSDEERVLVRGSTDAARATIRHFALNTAYHDAETNTLRITAADWLSGADRRMDQRTEAWRTVSTVAASIAAVPQAVRDPMIDQLRMLVTGQGFWSTCATALQAALGAEAPLARVLLPPGHPAKLDRAAGPPGGAGLREERPNAAADSQPARDAGAGAQPDDRRSTVGQVDTRSLLDEINAAIGSYDPELKERARDILLEHAFGPSREPAVPGPGFHNQFPGTRAGALG